MGVERAVLKVEAGTEDGGGRETTVSCQFNPTEFDVSHSARYSDKIIPGGRSTLSQFISGESPTLSVSLLFDTYLPPMLEDPTETGMDVTIMTEEVVRLTQVDGNLHRPPIVTFIWGTISFQGIITDVKQKFTMFLESGMPVRAKLDVTFRSISKDGLIRESPPASPDRTKYKVLKEGEYLWNYADAEYGSPGMWRVIARENGIMDPLDVEPGRMLKIPAI